MAFTARKLVEGDEFYSAETERFEVTDTDSGHKMYYSAAAAELRVQKMTETKDYEAAKWQSRVDQAVAIQAAIAAVE